MKANIAANTPIEGFIGKLQDTRLGSLYLGTREASQASQAELTRLKEEEGTVGFLKGALKEAIGHSIGADLAGKGTERTKAVALRGSIDIGTGVALEAGIRGLTGEGGLTTKNGERDIAGIPFI